ncbi:MAG TPA: ATP-grasp domain-containing protein [Candidatus Eisenbacteria bacterium]|nr:ATP-grasp domain-containing protein [Candidatus Eisenbacteria bacterium]
MPDSAASNTQAAGTLTVLCLASYFKGTEFLQECKRQGCRTLLLTSQSLGDANWPRESLDNIFYVPDEDKTWKLQDVLLGISHLAKTEVIDRIVPLDDFDVETAAALREHLRVPGMGDTTARYFRDKLAMRMRAREAGLPVPDFIHVLNYGTLHDFLQRVPPPWVLKPRSLAGSIGVKKISSADEFWSAVDRLGDQQSFYLLEQYVPGDIFHVDTITYENELLFSIASKYGRPPMDVSHEGDIFTTRTLADCSDDEVALRALNQRVLRAFGMVRGVSHSEFIQGRDGKLYFLETAARVGGAHIADLVEAATGINLWAEWAKVEIAGGKAPYQVPAARHDFAGLLISLARQQWPDTSAYNDPEIVWRMKKEHHVGLILRSQDPSRIEQLIRDYAQRFKQDFFASQPPREKPSS